MSEQNDKDLLLDHEYDGIRELNHPLPRWWLMIFYATIVFSIFYAGYYLTGIGPTLRDELRISMKELEGKKPEGGNLSDAAVMVSFSDPAKLKNGLAVYVSKCQACHGDKGQGIIGPNLTDDFWIHGSGAPGEIATVIRDGVLDKGMPTWSTLLSPQELLDVAAFVRSLHGTNPSGAKEPQGQQHEFKNL